MSGRPRVESRRQAGHWEGDLIIGAGQRSAIATLVERKFRTTILVPVPRDHSAQSVGDALIVAFSKLPASAAADIDLGPGQRNVPPPAHRAAYRTEDLLRRPALALAARQQREHQRPAAPVLPQGNRPQAWTAEQLDQVAAELNDRPRLCLDDRTPNEAMRRWARQQARR